MRNPLLFYLFPNRIERNKSKDGLFNFGILLYLIVVTIYSTINYFLGFDDLSKTFNTNKIVYNFIQLIVLIFYLPIRTLIFTTIGWVLLKLLLKTKSSFFQIYKILFISLNIVILYYLFETINIILFNTLSTKVVNIFNYSLNDILGSQVNWLQHTAKYFSKITPIIILSTVYYYYLLKTTEESSNIKLLTISSITICTTLLIFTVLSELTFYLLSKVLVV